MGHLLKLKCAHSPLSLRILSSTRVRFTLTTIQVLNLALLTRNGLQCMYRSTHTHAENTNQSRKGRRGRGGVEDLLGTPDTSLSGLRTLMALRVLRSTLSSSLAAAALSSSSCVRREMYLRGQDSLHYTASQHGRRFHHSHNNKSHDIVPLRKTLFSANSVKEHK
jgi:hypothetical protein